MEYKVTINKTKHLNPLLNPAYWDAFHQRFQSNELYQDLILALILREKNALVQSIETLVPSLREIPLSGTDSKRAAYNDLVRAIKQYQQSMNGAVDEALWQSIKAKLIQFFAGDKESDAINSDINQLLNLPSPLPKFVNAQSKELVMAFLKIDQFVQLSSYQSKHKLPMEAQPALIEKILKSIGEKIEDLTQEESKIFDALKTYLTGGSEAELVQAMHSFNESQKKSSKANKINDFLSFLQEMNQSQIKFNPFGKASSSSANATALKAIDELSDAKIKDILRLKKISIANPLRLRTLKDPKNAVEVEALNQDLDLYFEIIQDLINQKIANLLAEADKTLRLPHQALKSIPNAQRALDNSLKLLENLIKFTGPASPEISQALIEYKKLVALLSANSPKPGELNPSTTWKQDKQLLELYFNSESYLYKDLGEQANQELFEQQAKFKELKGAYIVSEQDRKLFYYQGHACYREVVDFKGHDSAWEELKQLAPSLFETELVNPPMSLIQMLISFFKALFPFLFKPKTEHQPLPLNANTFISLIGISHQADPNAQFHIMVTHGFSDLYKKINDNKGSSSGREEQGMIAQLSRMCETLESMIQSGIPEDKKIIYKAIQAYLNQGGDPDAEKAMLTVIAAYQKKAGLRPFSEPFDDMLKCIQQIKKSPVYLSALRTLQLRQDLIIQPDAKDRKILDIKEQILSLHKELAKLSAEKAKCKNNLLSLLNKTKPDNLNLSQTDLVALGADLEDNEIFRQINQIIKPIEELRPLVQSYDQDHTPKINFFNKPLPEKGRSSKRMPGILPTIPENPTESSENQAKTASKEVLPARPKSAEEDQATRIEESTVSDRTPAHLTGLFSVYLKQVPSTRPVKKKSLFEIAISELRDQVGTPSDKSDSSDSEASTISFDTPTKAPPLPKKTRSQFTPHAKEQGGLPSMACQANAEEKISGISFRTSMLEQVKETRTLPTEPLSDKTTSTSGW